MSLTENYGTGTSYVCYCGCDSSMNYDSALVDFAEAERRLARLKKLCREAIAFLMDWHARALKPWLVIGKRFDFRQSPRWSSARWKSKT